MGPPGALKLDITTLHFQCKYQCGSGTAIAAPKASGAPCYYGVIGGSRRGVYGKFRFHDCSGGDSGAARVRPLSRQAPCSNCG